MIILKNKGEIDLKTIKMMGVSVKESDSAIGYFGTGLKYAIATFLRNGINLELYIGENKYTFDTESDEVRGKEFDVCYMNGPYDRVELPFTTNYGVDWEPWMAYREIRSNCMDEGGLLCESLRPEPGYTIFTIDGDFSDSSVFLGDQNKTLLYSDNDIDIHKGESDHIYYRGIRAYNCTKRCALTYNIKEKCCLTEDRQIAYTHQVEQIISDAVATMKDKETIKTFVTAPKNSYEKTVDMKYWGAEKPGAEFLEVYGNNPQSHGHYMDQYVNHHKPKEPETKAQRFSRFEQQLGDLCHEFGCDYNFVPDDNEVTVAQISGDILS